MITYDALGHNRRFLALYHGLILVLVSLLLLLLPPILGPRLKLHTAEEEVGEAANDANHPCHQEHHLPFILCLLQTYDGDNNVCHNTNGYFHSRSG